MKIYQRIIIIVNFTFALFGITVFSTQLPASPAEVFTEAQQKQLDSYWQPFSEQTPRLKTVPDLDQSKVNTMISKAITFLLEKQNADGSWGGPYNTKRLNIYAPMPRSHNAFRGGTTALALSGLCEWESKAPQDVREKITPSIEKGQKWLLENMNLVRRSSMECTYNNWAQIYSLTALTRLFKRAQGNIQLQKQLVLAMQNQVAQLRHFECINGGWAYYDHEIPSTKPSSSPLSFVTAASLVSLYEVSQLDIPTEILESGKIAIPQSIIDRGITSITRQQKPDFTYLYGEYLKTIPIKGINRASGSLARSQSCNVALYYWATLKDSLNEKPSNESSADENQQKDNPNRSAKENIVPNRVPLPYSRLVTQQVMTDGLDRFCARIGWLDGARKHSVPHDHFNQIAGYFYYYGHLYASQVLLEINNREDQIRLSKHLTQILLDVQDQDGSFWDFVLYDYGQSYGTGMALISLSRCESVSRQD